MNKTTRMGHAPIPGLILRMSAPSMFSLLTLALYNVVDSIFVAQISEGALTAVSLAFPVQILMIAVSEGTAIGINSLMSRRLGENDKETATKAATHGLLLCGISSLLFALAGFFFSGPFMSLFTKNPDIYQMAFSYTRIVTIFSFGLFISVSFEKIMQATGNMIIPMIGIVLGSVFNIVFDPILIFGYFGFPPMGVAGAAIATVAGQFATLLFYGVALWRKACPLSLSFRGFSLHISVVKEIYAVGFPSIIMQAIGAVMLTCLNTILIGFSDAAVAVMGVYYKLQSFIYLPVFGLTHGVMPILGYNYGARNRKRLTHTLTFSILMALTVMAIGTIIFWIFPASLLQMFNSSAEMLAIGVPALRIISTSFCFAAVGIMLSTLFQAMGRGFYSLLLSLLRQMFIILPVSWVLSQIDLVYFWLGFPIAEVISVAIALLLYRNVYKNNILMLDAHS